jgi:hypothetical protein
MDTLSEPIQFLIQTKLLKRTGARMGKRAVLLDLTSGADVVRLKSLGFNAVSLDPYASGRLAPMEVDELPPADVVLLKDPSLVEQAWDLTHFLLAADARLTDELGLIGKVYELLPQKLVVLPKRMKAFIRTLLSVAVKDV